MLFCSKVWGLPRFSLRKRTLLFTKDALHWSNGIMKTFIVLQTIYISNKCSSFKLYIHQRGKKCIMISTKILNSTTVFNSDKKTEKLLEWLEWFLKDHVTLKTGVMMLKIQLYHHKYIFSKYIKIEITITTPNIPVFTVFLIIGEHNRLLSKT